MASSSTPAPLAPIDEFKGFLEGKSSNASEAALVAGGEALEDLVRDAVGKLGIGVEALAEVQSNAVTKFGVKGISHAGAHWVAGKFVEILKIDSPFTRVAIATFLSNMFAGGAIGVLDASALKGAQSTALVAISKDPAQPESGVVGIVWQGGVGGGALHPPKRDKDGNIALRDLGSHKVFDTECECLDRALYEHGLVHQPKAVQRKGKDGKVVGTDLVPSGVRFTNKWTDAATYLQAHPTAVCGDYALRLPSGKPVEAKSWLEEVGDEGKTLFDALLLYPHTTDDDKIDDIVGPDIAKEAMNVPVDEWKQLATDVTGNGGIYAECWAKDKGLTRKGFNLVLDKIRTRGKGGLELGNKAKVATLTAWDEAKKAWKKGGWLGWGLAALALAIPVGYAAAGAIIAMFYALGWFAPASWTVSNGVISLLAASIAGIVWLIPWYSADGLRRAFGGLANDAEKFAHTARNITALLCGFGALVVVGKLVGHWAGVSNDIVTLVTVVAFMAILAYDRIGARWHDEESIHHLVVEIAKNNIRLLQAVGALALLFAATFGVYDAYTESRTTFRLAVEQKVVDGVNVHYVPTPAGGAFRPEDIFGRVRAEEIETMGTQPRWEACLPAGTDLDLPGHSEKEAGPCKDLSGNAGVGYAVRGRLFGRFLDNWPRPGAKEYGSLEELYLETKKADEALANAVKAQKAQPAQTQAAPAGTTSVPAQTQAAPPQAAQTVQRGVDCAKLSFRSRRAHGCP